MNMFGGNTELSGSRKYVKFYLVAAILLSLAVAVVLSSCMVRRSRSKDIRNVLLISIDTCRADYLSCYGYKKKTTSNIDALAQKGVRFENVVSPVPLTLPAHSSMFTGTIPPYHGVHDNLDYKLDQSNITLAEILKAKGFTTGAIISAFVLDSRTGLDQGFDSYNDTFENKLKKNTIEQRRGGEVTRLAVKWLGEHESEKFFLFLHYYDPHDRYEPPEPFASKFSDNLYAGEIAYTDYCIGQVIEKLKESSLYDSTLIIITGDHGEMLGEHNELYHSYYIYQSAIKVPLIFKLPGQDKSKIVKEVVGLVDIVPTVCGLLDIDLPGRVDGVDLSGCLTQNKSAVSERYLYCESLTPTKYSANSLLGITTGSFKYIQTTRPELYDLIDDPHEANNLNEKQSHRSRVMKDELAQILERSVRSVEPESKMEMDDTWRKRLESLGYVGGGVTEEFKFDQIKEDPKDLIGVHDLHKRCLILAATECFEELKVLAQKLVDLKPDYDEGHYYLGFALQALGDFEKAASCYRQALQIRPSLSQGHYGLGVIMKSQGQLDEAADHFVMAIENNPNYAEAHHNLGNIFERQGKIDAAAKCYHKALGINAYLAETHHHLGNVLEKQGRIEESFGRYRRALKIKPGLKKLYLEIADKYLESQSSEHTNKAIRYLDMIIEADPGSYEIHYKLGIIYHRRNDMTRAVHHWKRALIVKPDIVGALNGLGWAMAVSKDQLFYDPGEAVKLSQRACELTNYQQHELLDTLAVAYGSVNDFAKAIETSQKAIEIAMLKGDQDLARDIETRLELYKSGRPYRE